MKCLFTQVLVAMLAASSVSAASLSKATLLNLQFEQKLNGQIPLALSFTNEAGSLVRLRDYFGARPVVLVLGYYECPMLCNLTLNGVIESFQQMRASAGKEFDVLFISINPRETPALAAAKKSTYLKRYGRADTANGWHFLIGGEREIKTLADAVGFQFAFDSTLKQYAHPSGIVVLTPDGRVAKYFFGVSYPAKEVSAALKEAGARRIGSPVRQLLILCFQQMPLVGKNSGAIMSAVRGLALATVIGVVAYVAFAVRREKRRVQPLEMQRAGAANPERIAAPSPGLQVRELPWEESQHWLNPSGVASSLVDPAAQPFQGCPDRSPSTQGSSPTRNPGLNDGIPLGFKDGDLEPASNDERSPSQAERRDIEQRP